MTKGHSLETLTAYDFRSIKGTPLRLTAVAPVGGSPISFEAEVADVTEYRARAQGSFRTPFSVIFHGPLEPVSPQGTYRLEHERLGTCELFIVPIGPNEPSVAGEVPAAMRYEAVFG